MSDTMLYLAEGVWNREPAYRLSWQWAHSPGVRFFDLPANQVANFVRAMAEIDDPAGLLPRDSESRRPSKVEDWLERAAARGDNEGIWRRAGELKPLTSEIPALLVQVLEATLDPSLAENEIFFNVFMANGAVSEEAVKRRKLAILKETVAALLKCHQSRDKRRQAEKNDGD